MRANNWIIHQILNTGVHGLLLTHADNPEAIRTFVQSARYPHAPPAPGLPLDAGLERKVVQKSGSYFSFDEERLGQGRQNATAFLREHPDVCQGILARIQTELGPEQVASARLLPVAADGGDQNGQVKGDAKERVQKAASK